MGRDRDLTTQVACRAAAHLVSKGGLVNPKSVLDSTQCLSWMGKSPGPHPACITHKPVGLADIIGGWLHVRLSRYTRKLKRLLSRIGWLARQSFSVGCFLAGARAWLRLGPPTARYVPFAVCRGLLEAIATGSRGWEPQPVQGPTVRIYIDAAACPGAPHEYFVGVWSRFGPAVRHCPPWVDTQYSAEL